MPVVRGRCRAMLRAPRGLVPARPPRPRAASGRLRRQEPQPGPLEPWWPRRIVGWAMANDLRTRLVLDALVMAVTAGKPRDAIHHGDQGPQDAPLAFGLVEGHTDRLRPVRRSGGRFRRPRRPDEARFPPPSHRGLPQPPRRTGRVAASGGWGAALRLAQRSMPVRRHLGGAGGPATPARSSARAARNNRSSRHGAAMSCTPIGRPPGAPAAPGSASGTAMAGKPMQEIGWV